MTTLLATLLCLAALVVFAIAALHDPASNPDHKNDDKPWGTI